MIEYFNCGRGVRQRDPSSPLLLCLVKKVLGKEISQLVSYYKILPMIDHKGKNFSTHVLYDDNIIVFIGPIGNL